MSETDDTIAAIIARRDAARAAIDAAYDELDTAKLAVIRGAAGRDATADETARMVKLDAGMGALASADSALALATVVALNQSSQAKALADSLDAINKTLKAKADDINAVAGTITKIGEAAKAVDGVVQTVMKLVTLFG